MSARSGPAGARRSSPQGAGRTARTPHREQNGGSACVRVSAAGGCATVCPSALVGVSGGGGDGKAPLLVVRRGARARALPLVAVAGLDHELREADGDDGRDAI